MWYVCLMDQTTTCNRELVLGRVDPYGPDCDLPAGHTGPHEAASPFEGDERRVRWTGGGMCAGDLLPLRNLAWVERK